MQGLFKTCVGEGLHPSPDPPPTAAPWQCPPSLAAGSATWLTVASGTAANMSSCGSQTHASQGFLTGSKRVHFQPFLG